MDVVWKSYASPMEAFQAAVELGFQPESRTVLVVASPQIQQAAVDHLMRSGRLEGCLGNRIAAIGSLIRDWSIEPDRESVSIRFLPLQAWRIIIEKNLRHPEKLPSGIARLAGEPGMARVVERLVHSVRLARCLFSSEEEWENAFSGHPAGRSAMSVWKKAIADLPESTKPPPDKQIWGVARFQEALENGDSRLPDRFHILLPGKLPPPARVAMETILSSGRGTVFQYQAPDKDSLGGKSSGSGVSLPIEIHEAGSSRQEVRVVLGRIKDFLLKKGENLRPCDFALIIRNEDRYLNHVEEIAEDYALPFQFRRERIAIEVPVVQTLLLPLRVVVGGYPADLLGDLIGHSLFQKLFWPEEEREIGSLLKRMIREQVFAGKAGRSPHFWRRAFNAGIGALLAKSQLVFDDEVSSPAEPTKKSSWYREKAEALRTASAWLGRVIERLEILAPTGADAPDNPGVLEERVRSFFGVGEDGRGPHHPLSSPVGVALADRAQSAKNHREARQNNLDFLGYGIFWAGVEATAQSFSRAGVGSVSLSEFTERFIEDLEERPAVEADLDPEGIFVTTPEDFPPTGFACVAIIGVNESEYPLYERAPFLMDEPLAALAGRPSFEENLRIEEDLFGRILAGSREQAILSYSVSDEAGKTRLPSSFVEGMREEFETRQVHPLSHHCREGDPVWGPRERLERLLSGTQSFTESDLEPSIRVFSEEFEGKDGRWAVQAIFGAALEAERFSPRACSLYDGVIVHESADEKRRLLTIIRDRLESRSLSPSRLNILGTCRAKFYYDTILGLKIPEIPEHELSPLERGSLVHRVMERFIRLFLPEERAKWTWPIRPDEEERAIETFKDIIVEEFLTFEQEQGYRPLSILQKEDLQKQAAYIVKREILRGTYPYRPWRMEWKFEEFRPEGLQFDPPLGVSFSGRIDRVDRHSEAPDRVLVLDYKTGKSEILWKDMISGDAFQIPIYARYLAEAEGKIVDYSFFYSLLKTKEEDDDYLSAEERRRPPYRDPSHPEVDPSESDWNGIVLPLLIDLIGKAAAGIFIPKPIDWKRCDWCDFNRICRKDKERISGKTFTDTESTNRGDHA